MNIIYLSLLSVIACFILFPAIDSRFMLDDFYNLAELSQIDEHGYLYYVFQGFAGHGGRPVSLFSFALQYQHWPSDPAAFKLVNLFIHICNGMLVWILSKTLYPLLNLDKKYKLLFISAVTFIWLIHPMQYSTVFYTVQRMTLLSGFFTLLGIIGYIKYRRLTLENHSLIPVLSMFLVVLSAIFFGVFSKENGILISLYILVIEFTLLKDKVNIPLWRWAQIVLLILPLLLLIVYLLINFDSVLASYQSRPYTMYQRLLTQANVLFTYISNLVIPIYSNFTLYHDDYMVASDLFNPGYTLVSVIGLFLILISALIFRKRLPVYSFAVLWFLTAHSLESSYLNLEIYFEHRNYLASFAIFLLIIWLLFKLGEIIRFRNISTFIISIYSVLILTVSILVSQSWSNPIIQINEWVKYHPKSKRTLADASLLYANIGDYENALHFNNNIISKYPNEMSPRLNNLYIKACIQGENIKNDQWRELQTATKIMHNYELTAISSLDALVNSIIQSNCENLYSDQLIILINSMLANTGNSKIRKYGSILNMVE